MAEDIFWTRVEDAVKAMCNAESAVQAMCKKVRRAFVKGAQVGIWNRSAWGESIEAYAVAVYDLLAVSLDEFPHELDLVEALDAALRFLAPRDLFEGVLGTLQFEQAVVAAHDRAHQQAAFQVVMWSLCDQLCCGPSAKKKVRHAAENAFKEALSGTEARTSLRSFIFVFIDHTIRRLAEEAGGYPQMYLEEQLAKRLFNELLVRKALCQDLVKANQTAQAEGRDDDYVDPHWWVDHVVKTAYSAHVALPERQRKRRRLIKQEFGEVKTELALVDRCSSDSEREEEENRRAEPKARPLRGPTLRPVSTSDLPYLTPQQPPPPPALPVSQSSEGRLHTSSKAAAPAPAKSRPSFPPRTSLQPLDRSPRLGEGCSGIVKREHSWPSEQTGSRAMQASSSSSSLQSHAKEELGETSSLSEGQEDTVADLQARIKKLQQQLAMQENGRRGVKHELEEDSLANIGIIGRRKVGGREQAVKNELDGESRSSSWQQNHR